MMGNVDEASKCADKNNGEVVSWHGFENTHFYPVEYMPRLGIYVRLALAPTTLPHTATWDDVMASRRMYMMAFGRDFAPIGEWKLPQGRYNPFFGWAFLPHEIAFFVDNSYGDEASESTFIDRLKINRLSKITHEAN